MAIQRLSGKSFLTAFWLSTFLGVIGVDRFYLGQRATGIFKLATLGGLGVWALADVFYTLSGQRRDANGTLLSGVKGYQNELLLSLPVGAMCGLLTLTARRGFGYFGAHAPNLHNGVTPELLSIFTVSSFVLGILVFIGFNIVDPAKQKRWGWASANLICSVLGLGFVGLYYYLFVRKGKGSTAII